MNWVRACKGLIPPVGWGLLRAWAHPGKVARERELQRLLRMPRYVAGQSDLPGVPIRYADAASFAAQYQEIFLDEVYALPPSLNDPVILDCGANIGMALAYWRLHHPAAHITCFEADPSIVSFLEANAASLPATGTTHLIPKAVWIKDDSLCFDARGGDAGRLTREGGVRVEALRLRSLLPERVDLLKIDVEGAEVALLQDLDGALDPVARVVLEYHSFHNHPQGLGTVVRVLEKAGYRLVIRHLTASLHPFLRDHPPGEMDQQLLIHAWRPEAAEGRLAGLPRALNLPT